MRLKLLIIGLIFGVLYAGYYSQAFNKILSKKPAVNSEFHWDIPTISPDFEWKVSQISSDSTEAANFPLFWDNRYSPNSESYLQYGNVTIGGTLYELTLSDDDPQYEQLSQYIKAGLGEDLLNRGWTNSIDYANWAIIGAVADGVFGGVTGSIKMDGSKVRTVAYSYDTKVSEWEGPHTAAKCPCTLEAKILVSDVEELSGHIPSLIPHDNQGISDWLKYENAQYNYSILYPADFVVKKVYENDTAGINYSDAIVIEKPETAQKIFISAGITKRSHEVLGYYVSQEIARRGAFTQTHRYVDILNITSQGKLNGKDIVYLKGTGKYGSESKQMLEAYFAQDSTNVINLSMPVSEVTNEYENLFYGVVSTIESD